MQVTSLEELDAWLVAGEGGGGGEGGGDMKGWGGQRYGEGGKGKGEEVWKVEWETVQIWRGCGGE